MRDPPYMRDPPTFLEVNRENIPKLLRIIAESPAAKESGQNHIFAIAADMIDELFSKLDAANARS